MSDRLAEIRATLDEASHGWVAVHDTRTGLDRITDLLDKDVPWLLAEVERLQQENKAIQTERDGMLEFFSELAEDVGGVENELERVREDAPEPRDWRHLANLVLEWAREDEAEDREAEQDELEALRGEYRNLSVLMAYGHKSHLYEVARFLGFEWQDQSSLCCMSLDEIERASTMVREAIQRAVLRGQEMVEEASRGSK